MNPFIELARDPVTTLSAAGYLVLVAGVLVVGVPHAVKILVEEVYLDWLRNRERGKWKRLWGEGYGYIPPNMVALKALWASFVLFMAFQSVAALLWFGGVHGV